MIDSEICLDSPWLPGAGKEPDMDTFFGQMDVDEGASNQGSVGMGIGTWMTCQNIF